MIPCELPVKSRYLPILKVKQAEFDALKELPNTIRRQLTPVMEFRAEPGAETWSKRLSSHWGEGAPIFVDVVPGRRGVGLAQASDVLARVLEYCRLKGVRAIPVTGLERPGKYQEVVEDAAAKDRRGVLIRLSPDDSEREADLGALIGHHVKNRTALGVLLDFGAIEPSAATQTAHAADSLLRPLSAAATWTLIALASTSFPQRLGDLEREDIGDGITRAVVKRADWDVWNRLNRRTSDVSSLPVFSDYSVQHPKEADIDKKTIPRVPNIRYTLDDTWVIYQGKNLNKVAKPTFGDLCRVLTARKNEFAASGHCNGDEFLDQCARGEIKPMPASYPSWRRPCFTHHLTKVIHQLAR